MSGTHRAKSGPPEPTTGDDHWQLLHTAMSGPVTDFGQDAPTPQSAAERLALLFKTVETEVIPRLMLLHRGPPRRSGEPGAADADISDQQVADFTQLAINNHDSAAAFVNALLNSGTTLDNIFLNLLAPAARRLGDMWSADLCDFTDVTIALGRLQRVLRDLSGERRSESRGTRERNGRIHRALLIPIPGEQHTFGLTMVSEFFRDSGWDVWGEMPETGEQLMSAVRENHFDLVGFSIGNGRSLDLLASLIREVRTASRNSRLRVMVGGPLLVERPQIASLVGADATAADARQAMLLAEKLLEVQDSGR